MTNQETGKAGESSAAKYLKKKGYKVLERNYRNPFGEIDLIAASKEVLIFCEVKTRNDESFGLPREAVGPFRQRRYRNAAEIYLKENNFRNIPVRFDVIEILKGEITHIENAF